MIFLFHENITHTHTHTRAHTHTLLYFMLHKRIEIINQYKLIGYEKLKKLI